MWSLLVLLIVATSRLNGVCVCVFVFNEESIAQMNRELESEAAVINSNSPLHLWGLLRPRLQSLSSNWRRSRLALWAGLCLKNRRSHFAFSSSLTSSLSSPSSSTFFLPSRLLSWSSPLLPFLLVKSSLSVAHYVSGIFLCGIDTAVTKSEKFLPDGADLNLWHR